MGVEEGICFKEKAVPVSAGVGLYFFVPFLVEQLKDLLECK